MPHHRGVDADDVPEGEDFANDTLVVRWATDPAGRMCQIVAEIPGPIDFPMWTPDDEDGPLLRFMLWRANRRLQKGYERGQRRRTGPPTWYLSVWRREGTESLLLEEELTDPQAARLRIDDLVRQVAAGTLESTD
jgi:hypothetical protein